MQTWKATKWKTYSQVEVGEHVKRICSTVDGDYYSPMVWSDWQDAERSPKPFRRVDNVVSRGNEVLLAFADGILVSYPKNAKALVLTNVKEDSE